ERPDGVVREATPAEEGVVRPAALEDLPERLPEHLEADAVEAPVDQVLVPERDHGALLPVGIPPARAAGALPAEVDRDVMAALAELALEALDVGLGGLYAEHAEEPHGEAHQHGPASSPIAITGPSRSGGSGGQRGSAS